MSFSLLFTVASVLFSLLSLSSVLTAIAQVNLLAAILLAVLVLGLLGGLLLWSFRSARRTGNPDYLIAAAILLAAGVAALLLKEQLLGLISGLTTPVGPGELPQDILK